MKRLLIILLLLTGCAHEDYYQCRIDVIKAYPDDLKFCTNHPD